MSYVPTAEDFLEQFRQRFRLVCQRCGSTNGVLDLEQGIDYGGETGYSPGHITVGCNACKQSDLYLSI